jgi:uncharacterized protein
VSDELGNIYDLEQRDLHHDSRGTAPKVERNDPCPCGSGKKYKRCCGGATVD